MTPQFLGPDGAYRETLYLSTANEFQFFTGQMDADTADMLVSINGATPSANPDLISFEGTVFTVPNPAAYPHGLQMFVGSNTLEVQSVLSNGTSTSKAIAYVTLVTDQDLATVTEAPTGVRVERRDSSVKITVPGISDDRVVAYNFYATTQPGGGSIGWYRINPRPVTGYTTAEVVTELGTLETDSVVALDQQGLPQADPLYFTLEGRQETQLEEVIQTDFTEAISVPETTRRIRSSIVVSDVVVVREYSFVHDRKATASSANPAIPNSLFQTISVSDPLYYAVSAVYLVNGVEVESSLSAEVAGSPIILEAQIASLPVVEASQTTTEILGSLSRTNPKLNLSPGSPVRDIFVEPAVWEFQRQRFVLQFIHNASNFRSMLAIDDPGNTGTSISVSRSPYKQNLKSAFYLKSDVEVQNLIDSVFDSLAAKVGVLRSSGVRARGEVTIYTPVRPTVPYTFRIGQSVEGGGVQFRLTSNATLDASTGAYSPKTGRWAVKAFIEAVTPGEAGNVGPGVIKTIVGGPSGVRVTNEDRCYGGLSRLSNRELALLSERKIAGVDTGTVQGLIRKALEFPGVREATVVGAGHDLMFRDFEGDHSGGMADLWVRTSRVSTVTDSWAFRFETRRKVQVEVLGDPQDLIFRVVSSEVTSSNPLVEVLDFPGYGYSFRNESKGYDFDLTGYTLLSSNTFQLDPAVNDPSDLDLEDLLRADIRFREGTFALTRQPIKRVLSVSAEVTGDLTESQFGLRRSSSPLIVGQSTQAEDLLVISQSSSSPISSQPLSVVGEAHAIQNGVEYLSNLGVNPLTIRVWTLDRSVEYISPYSSTGTPDYTIIEGDPVTPWGIRATSGGRLSEGAQVVIDYYHDEVFTAQYESESIISALQDDLSNETHVCSNILVKSAIEVPIKVSAVVLLRDSRSRDTVASTLRADLITFVNSKSLGATIWPSEIIDLIQSNPSTEAVLVPLVSLTRADGARVTHEVVTTDSTQLQALTSWETSTTQSYLLNTPLQYLTFDGGGSSSDFRGVMVDGVFVNLFSEPSGSKGTPQKYTPNSAYIVGPNGIAIFGYSDDATLGGTPSSAQQQRKDLTANRVILTVPKGTDLSASKVHVTYVVGEDTSVVELNASPIEFFSLNSEGIEFVFDERAR